MRRRLALGLSVSSALLFGAPAAGNVVTTVNQEPVWAPHGKTILYASYREHESRGMGLWLVNADGTHRRVLARTPFGEGDGEPTWSPDGTKVAFVRCCNPRIWTMNADGSGPREVLAGGEQPRWSPDSRRIVFQIFPLARDKGIAVMSADGTGVTRIANGDIGSLDWSSANRIAFYSEAGAGIYTMNPDGTDVRFLVAGGGRGTDWSPDATKIAYGADGGLRVVNADGGGQRPLTSGRDSEPDWSPDGRRIVFTRAEGDGVRTGFTSVYVVNADGTGLKKLVTGRQVLCRVPIVRGLTLRGATAKLREHDCSLGRVLHAYSGARKGRVVRQRPRPGLEFAAGKPVLVILSRGLSAR